jgi:hypothetical protein
MGYISRPKDGRMYFRVEEGNDWEVDEPLLGK